MTSPLADNPVRLGIVGCGVISDIYLKNLPHTARVEVVACADLVPERAAGAGGEVRRRRRARSDELLADPEIEVVLNLTIPTAHAAVALAARRAPASRSTTRSR